MTSDELKELQIRIKFDAPSVAACLEIPYHTYRNYLYGVNVIPETVYDKLLELENNIKKQDAERLANLDKLLDSIYPNGIKLTN